MLKSHKLFEVNTKTAYQKPAYVKPKYKTYIELLGLDKPKKKIFVQSDNQHDDFLEKLLKEEEKGKKMKKKQLKQKKKNKVNLNHEQPNENISKDNKNEKNQKNKKNHFADGPDLTDNKNQKILRKNVFREYSDDDAFNKSKSKSPKNYPGDEFLLNEGSLKIKRRMQSARKRDQKNERASINNANTNRSDLNNEIMIDQTNEVPYAITNSFKQNHLHHVKSQFGLKMLRDVRSKSNSHSSNQKLSVGTVLNPEKNQIVHKLSEIETRRQFKAKVLSTKQLLSMTNLTKTLRISRKPHFIKEEALFKSEKEQIIFLSNLKKDIQKRTTFNLKEFD